MNSLLGIFLIVGAFGFLFLLVSLVIGDLFEFFEADLDLDSGADSTFSWFDTRVLSVALASFGAIGALTVQFEFGLTASLVSAAAAGLIFGSIVFAFGYFLYSQQSSSSVSNRDLIGRTGKVTVAIKPGSVGQISLLIGEERIDKIARTEGDKELQLGEAVFVESSDAEGCLVSTMTGYESTESK